MITEKLGLGVGRWVAAGVMLLGCACAAADFSADMVMGGGGTPVKGKIYVSSKMFRQDMSAANYKQITILRSDKRVAYIIYPTRKEYSEIRDSRIAGQNPRSDAFLTRMGVKKVLGKEKVNGFTCEKAVYTFKNRPGDKITRWFSKDLDWVMKTEMKMGAASPRSEEIKNVKIGKQPASLFEVPKGYKKVDLAQHKGIPLRKGPGKPGARNR